MIDFSGSVSWRGGLAMAVVLVVSQMALADPAATTLCAHPDDEFDGAYPEYLGDPSRRPDDIPANSDPLEFARVIGASGERARLRSEHPVLCSAKEDKRCSDGTSVPAGDTVATGTRCGEWTYVQYIGRTKASKGWIESSRLQPLSLSLPFDGGVPGGQSREQYSARWMVSVRLVHGHGVPVCQAYLQRINQTIFYEPPFCGRPDNDQIPGFARLRAVELTAAQVNDFAVSRVNTATYPQVRFRKQPGAIELAAAQPQQSVALDTLGVVLSVRAGQRLSVWRYEPPVDVDNDGAADNVILWRGTGNPVWEPCGLQTEQAPEGASLGPVPLILAADGKSVDVPKTKTIFGSPAHRDEMGHHSRGYSVNVFKYRDQFYFDAFVDDTGERRSLSVFKYSSGRLDRVCQLENSESHWRLP